jgi:hypothetical protein
MSENNLLFLVRPTFVSISKDCLLAEHWQTRNQSFDILTKDFAVIKLEQPCLRQALGCYQP